MASPSLSPVSESSEEGRALCRPGSLQENAWTAPHAATASHTVGALRYGTLLALGTSSDL